MAGFPTEQVEGYLTFRQKVSAIHAKSWDQILDISIAEVLRAQNISTENASHVQKIGSHVCGKKAAKLLPTGIRYKDVKDWISRQDNIYLSILSILYITTEQTVYTDVITCYKAHGKADTFPLKLRELN